LTVQLEKARKPMVPSMRAMLAQSMLTNHVHRRCQAVPRAQDMTPCCRRYEMACSGPSSTAATQLSTREGHIKS